MHRTVHRNPLGGHTTVYFDEQRRVLRVDRFETRESATLAWQGLYPTQLVDAAGAVTQLAWQDGRVATRVTPSGNAIAFTHAPGALSPDAPARDPVLRVEDSLGLVEARSYDAEGRPVGIQNGAGETRALAWNGASLSSLESGGVAASFPSYGAHGHWLDTAVGGTVVSRRAFDPVGNETVPSDSQRPGGALGFAFDADRHWNGMQVAASDDAGRVAATATIELEPRSDGALSRIARPYGGDHELLRDALGRVVRIREKSEGHWRETRIEYDAQGDVTARELANGMRREWDYDVFGRVVAHRALRSGVLEGEETFTWQSGRLAARTDSLRDAGEVYVHDGGGRTISVIFGYGETISYEFDPRDRVVREVYSIPGVGVVADLGTEYDGADRRVAIQDRASGAALVAWRFEEGRLAAIDTGNGLHRIFAYDEQGRLAGQETRNASGAPVETTSIQREIASNPPRLEVRSQTTTAVAATEERYWLPPGGSLASLDQRVGKRVFGWSDGSGPARRYAWDELGNRASTSTGDDFVYDAERAHLLFTSLAAEGESHAYLYDDAGFATSRDGVPLRWTATGRLASHGADAIDWDMAGRPIAVTESGVTREFRFFGGRIESSASALGALDLGDVVLALGSGARRWRHFDFRDQVSFVSDESGAVVAHYRYHPFGVDAAFGPEAGSGRFENRAAFGPFYLLGQRVLDPAMGRFLSPDPVLQPGSQYAYAYGNPIEFEDADGMDPESRADGYVGDSIRAAGSMSAVLGAIAVGAEPVLILGAALLALANIAEYANHYYGQGPGFAGNLTPGGDGGGGGGGGGPGGGGGRGSGSGCGCKLELELGAATSPSIGSGGSVGCAPLALTRQGDAPERLLLVLLMANAVVALAWWRRRKRGFER
jgi:RHS repeat-associated protein